MTSPASGASSGADPFRAYDVIRSDPEWPAKLGLFLVIWLIPLLGWFLVLGWLSYGARRAVAGISPVLLPPTTDLTTLLDYGEQGLKAFLVSLVWTLPALAVTFAGIGCIYFAFVASMVSALAGAESTDGASLAVIPVFLCGGLVFMAIMAVLNALLSLPAGAAVMRCELSGQLARGFDVSSVLTLVRLVLRDWVLNFVLLALVSMVGVLFANLLPIVGVFVMTFLLTITRLFAAVSVYEKYLARGGEPVALGPMEPRVSTR